MSRSIIRVAGTGIKLRDEAILLKSALIMAGNAAAKLILYTGDPSGAGASAGSPVAGGSNTGDGTVTGVAVHNDFTVTETWTLTCITEAVDGGVFSVIGSVSGSLPNATVGVAYVSRFIDFTINDGATDFVTGDSFTIAVVASTFYEELIINALNGTSFQHKAKGVIDSFNIPGPVYYTLTGGTDVFVRIDY